MTSGNIKIFTCHLYDCFIRNGSLLFFVDFEKKLKCTVYTLLGRVFFQTIFFVLIADSMKFYINICLIFLTSLIYFIVQFSFDMESACKTTSLQRYLHAHVHAFSNMYAICM